jgi:hypothetical protein
LSALLPVRVLALLPVWEKTGDAKNMATAIRTNALNTLTDG